jgi:hypothetical protein
MALQNRGRRFRSAERAGRPTSTGQGGSRVSSVGLVTSLISAEVQMALQK